MSRIKHRGNRTTEETFRQLLRLHGLHGWRRHLPLPGRPDFTFRKQRVVIFIDGCFWHGCQRCSRLPLSNVTYWTVKIGRNKSRDKRTARQLRATGWRVIRVWEHSLKETPGNVISRVKRALQCS